MMANTTVYPCAKCGQPSACLIFAQYACHACYYEWEFNGRPSEWCDHVRFNYGDVDAALGELRTEIDRARSLHPTASFAALIEEIGEVATDIQDGKDTRVELIQVACVAIRLAVEPWGK